MFLEDGSLWEGMAVGGRGDAKGELCFNTGMMGYEEMYSDPSYFGQIIVNTQSHIGNYGIRDDGEESESEGPKIRGCVFLNAAHFFSRGQASIGFRDYLEKYDIPAIAGVDTRALVRHLCHKGSMNAIISSTQTDKARLQKALASTPAMEGLPLAHRVSTPKKYTAPHRKGRHVAVLDLGAKRSILSHLERRGIGYTVHPATTSFEAMEKEKPAGYLISNGPGDPAALPEVVGTIKKIVEKNRPLFGICLGHQLLALSCGISTYKLKHGHRGVNHAVKNVETGLCEVSSQNHGFSVNKEEVMQSAAVVLTHIHLNDGSVAGIRLRDRHAFSVQFHPEASPGPHDSWYLLDDFVSMLETQG